MELLRRFYAAQILTLPTPLYLQHTTGDRAIGFDTGLQAELVERNLCLRSLIEGAQRERDIASAVTHLAIKEESVDWTEDAPLDLSRSSPTSPVSPCGNPATPPAGPSSSASSSPSLSAITKGRTRSSTTYSCKYCELDFRDLNMYNIHMNYHGIDQPFKCKVCGEQTAGPLDFYVHLNRNPH